MLINTSCWHTEPSGFEVLNGLMENMFWVSRLVGNSKVISANLTAFVDHDQPMALCNSVAKGHGWLPGILRLTVAPDQGRGQSPVLVGSPSDLVVVSPSLLLFCPFAWWVCICALLWPRWHWHAILNVRSKFEMQSPLWRASGRQLSEEVNTIPAWKRRRRRRRWRKCKTIRCASTSRKGGEASWPQQLGLRLALKAFVLHRTQRGLRVKNSRLLVVLYKCCDGTCVFYVFLFLLRLFVLAFSSCSSSRFFCCSLHFLFFFLFFFFFPSSSSSPPWSIFVMKTNTWWGHADNIQKA